MVNIVALGLVIVLIVAVVLAELWVRRKPKELIAGSCRCRSHRN